MRSARHSSWSDIRFPSRHPTIRFRTWLKIGAGNWKPFPKLALQSAERRALYSRKVQQHHRTPLALTAHQHTSRTVRGEDPTQSRR
jgi:hypothetical protein